MSKLRKIFLLICVGLFLVSLSFSIATVWAKYVSEQGGNGTLGGDDGYDLPYEVSNPVTVNTQEDLFNAIQYGYSHIKLGDQMKNPFIVTENVTNLNRSLILDLNGKEIQRNSRDPMLSIGTDVTLTLIDTSADKSGGLYNPVGSVLLVNGGSLLVTQGKFESGPRPAEYFSKEAADRIDTQQSLTVSVSTQSGVEQRSMPVFVPKVTWENGEVSYVDGNVYFDVQYGSIAADTYCYFVTSDGFTSGETVAFDKTAADFAYSYYAHPSTSPNAYQYIGVSAPSGTLNEDYVEVTIYGYERNIATAMEADVNYAAVTMESGNLDIDVNAATNTGLPSESGSFWSYFGVASSYCVNATGGTMTVNTTGMFSTVNPDDIPAAGLAKESKGVCISCSYQTDRGSLTLDSGTYVSYLGDTIYVSAGHMYVNGGTFQKDASSSKQSAIGANDAIIGISGSGSELDIAGSSEQDKIKFNLSGSGVYGIRSSGTGNTSLTVTNAEFRFEEKEGNTYWSNNHGMYVTGGTINATNCLFDVASNNSYGIRSVDGNTATSSAVNVNHCVFNMTGQEAVGVYAAAGEVNLNGSGTANSYSLFYIEHVVNCYGVYAAGSSALDVNVNSAQFFMGQTYYATEGRNNARNGAAVYADNANAVIRLGDGLFITAGDAVSGVYANAGEIQAVAGDHKTVIITGAVYDNYVAGVSHFPRGGNDYTVDVVDSADFAATQTDATASHGIITLGGTITLDSVFVSVFGSHASGIYSVGGDILINGNMDLVVRTVDNVNTRNLLTSTAVGTQGGNVTLNGSAKVLSDSLGIYVESGNLDVNDALEMNSTRGTAVYVNGGNLKFTHGKSAVIDCVIDETCKWRDGDGYSDAVLVHSGTFTTNGQLTIHHKGLPNSTAFSGSMIRSYAVRVEGTEQQKSTFESLSDQNTMIENTVGGGIYVNGGDILINRATIQTEGYGLALRGSTATSGAVTIQSGLDLVSTRTTGIYITGGSLTLESGSVANIDSTIDIDYTFCETTATITDDAVFVQNGSLDAKGTFNVTHTGLESDRNQTGAALYRDYVINSYAVRVDTVGSSVANVFIQSGTIVNDIGGGVYVSGGNVTLGDGGDNSLITVRTEGYELHDGYQTIVGAANNWAYRLNKTGGPAVKLNGGSLTIHNGTYVATQGDGIVVQNGTAEIRGGQFIGNDYYEASSGGLVAGVAASYAFKVYGGTANVYNGSFGSLSDGTISNGNGALVTGDAASQVTAVANIYGGSFVVNGQGGFSIYEYATVTFDPYGGANGSGGEIYAKGDAAGLIIERSNGNNVRINIDGGTFESIRTLNGDGIWYGDADAELYISGGTFIGTSRSGLHSDGGVNPGSNIQLSGGTFKGGESGIGGTYTQWLILVNGFRFQDSWDGGYRVVEVVPN